MGEKRLGPTASRKTGAPAGHKPRFMAVCKSWDAVGRDGGFFPLNWLVSGQVARRLALADAGLGLHGRGGGVVQFRKGRFKVKSPVCLASLFVLLAAGVAAAAEGIAHFFNGDLRLPVYAGGIAGIVLGLTTLPFAVKLAKLDKQAGMIFWRWWAGGVLARLFLLIVLALGLGFKFREHCAAALLALGCVYLAGMFAEAFWLARRLWR